MDLIRWLFGEAVQVSGFSNSFNENISLSLSLKFENGITGSVYFSGMSAWSRESESLLVTFDHGFAHADEVTSLTIHHTPDSGSSWQSLGEQDIVFTPSASAMSGAYRDLYLRGFIGEMKHFMECCTTGTPPRSSGQDNVGTMRLCDDILASVAVKA